jgi:hypothetical protein
VIRKKSFKAIVHVLWSSVQPCSRRRRRVRTHAVSICDVAPEQNLLSLFLFIAEFKKEGRELVGELFDTVVNVEWLSPEDIQDRKAGCPSFISGQRALLKADRNEENRKTYRMKKRPAGGRNLTESNTLARSARRPPRRRATPRPHRRSTIHMKCPPVHTAPAPFRSAALARGRREPTREGVRPGTVGRSVNDHVSRSRKNVDEYTNSTPSVLRDLVGCAVDVVVQLKLV